MFSKILKQQFTYTTKLSQFDSSPDKAPHNNPMTYFFFLNHCIELLNLLMLKILEITMDIHHFTKLTLLGFSNKKSPKLIKIWKLFFKKHNKTNTKISGRLSQPWQLLIFSKQWQFKGEGWLSWWDWQYPKKHQLTTASKSRFVYICQ